MKLLFNPETLLPNQLPAAVPDWVRQMPPQVPQALRPYDLALLRRQQHLLCAISATLEEQGAPEFLIKHLDSVVSLLSELVTPYMVHRDGLPTRDPEAAEAAWLPDFAPLPIFWRPTDPAIEISSEAVEAFDQAASQPHAVVTVNGGVAEVRATRPGVEVVVVDYDVLGAEQGEAHVQQLLAGMLDLADWIPDYPPQNDENIVELFLKGKQQPE